ncbi:hypothetical protein ABZ645_00565 [Nocardiopsis alba]|uniref:hypothetical protein n=1 Tax=Nocardiopsis alba TaxID=53437 RepID=UPI00340F1BDF
MPEPLPRPITGVFVRQVVQTACPGHFALMWLDAAPPPEGAETDRAVDVVDDLPPLCREPLAPLPGDFARAFAEGFRRRWSILGPDRSPPYAVRIVLRDALWHEVDSNTHGFERAGVLAADEILSCVREGRPPRPAGRPVRPDARIPPMPRLTLDGRPGGDGPPG